jgi:hypothetical protein
MYKDRTFLLKGLEPPQGSWNHKPLLMPSLFVKLRVIPATPMHIWLLACTYNMLQMCPHRSKFLLGLGLDLLWLADPVHGWKGARSCPGIVSFTLLPSEMWRTEHLTLAAPIITLAPPHQERRAGEGCREEA